MARVNWGQARIKAALRAAKDFLTLTVARLYFRKLWILSQHTGALPLAGAKRVAIFVTWDRYGFIHDFVLAHLDGLRSADFATIVVVNSPKLTAEALARLSPRCSLILHRANRGYDFGAYHDGLQFLPADAALEGVLLMNDSTYGPLFDMRTHVLDRIDADAAQVWSLTDSWEHSFHLQSYFLYATKPALASKAWKDFWKSFLHIENKRLIIERYEIGLTQALIHAGIPCRALFPYRELSREYVEVFSDPKLLDGGVYSPQQVQALRHVYDSIRNGMPMNASHFLWDRLLLTHRCAYLKRELLSLNPTGVPVAGLWDVAIRSVSSYDVDMIERHLQTIIRNRSP